MMVSLLQTTWFWLAFGISPYLKGHVPPDPKGHVSYSLSLLFNSSLTGKYLSEERLLTCECISCILVSQLNVVVRTLESNSSINRVLHKMSLWVGWLHKLRNYSKTYHGQLFILVSNQVDHVQTVSTQLVYQVQTVFSQYWYIRQNVLPYNMILYCIILFVYQVHTSVFSQWLYQIGTTCSLN